ncbi:YbjQ family protein [Desulfobotulus sp.]|uniref:YbjQ family protein n=1 Tax=Desulfobotulus sp. TaxID=1940337 RepID=UPI002A36A00B|nr:YbjQ family protein [Desulfobotulus sp.]MDY0162204.1 YbjQ family protein [Desulfobotulus sp.]
MIMIITTTNEIPGSPPYTILGMVEGSVVFSRHLGKDILAALKSLIGGELKGYTQLLEESRKRAMQRMIAQAQAMEADAILCVRYSTSSIMATSSEVLCYGTAVSFR